VAFCQAGVSSWANGSVSSARSTLPSVLMMSFWKQSLVDLPFDGFWCRVVVVVALAGHGQGVFEGLLAAGEVGGGARDLVFGVGHGAGEAGHFGLE